MSYRTLSPRDRASLDAATSRAAVFGRDDLVVVRATGKHHRRFLHALTTAPFQDAPGDLAFDATQTDAQGRLLAALRCITSDDAVEVWLHRPLAQTWIDKLLAHRVAERVQLALDEDATLVELIGPAAPTIADAVLRPLVAADGAAEAEPAAASGPATAPEAKEAAVHPSHAVHTCTLPGDGGRSCRVWRDHTGGGDGSPLGPALPRVCIRLQRDDLGLLVPALLREGAAVGCFAAGEVLRVGAGEPRLSLDVHDGSTPWEVGLHDGVSLSKGCYLGQEALAMQAWRGQLRRALCWVEPIGAPPPPGTQLRDAQGRKAGFSGSGVDLGDGRRYGFATVQRKAAVAGTELTWSLPATEGQDGTPASAGGLRVVATTRAGTLQA